MSTANVSWVTPTIESQNIFENKIKMSVDFHDGGVNGDITITRNQEGWIVEDKGNFRRFFKDAEFLRYEFEYPESLVPQLLALPKGDDVFEPYMNHEALNAQIEPLVKMMMAAQQSAKHKKPGAPGSNVTPKKKKRKKRK